MKIVLTTSLLFLISLITVKEMVYIALFKANQSYIALNYCENDDLLDNISNRTCQGKCYVQKIIVENNSESSTNDQAIPTLDWEKTNIIIEQRHYNIPTTLNLTTNPISKLLGDSHGIHRRFESPPEFL